MSEECTTPRTDTRCRIEKREPGRISMKIDPPLNAEETDWMIREMRAQFPDLEVVRTGVQ